MPSQASYIFKYVFQLISLHSYFLFPTSVTHPYHFILLKYTSICEVPFVICCFFTFSIIPLGLCFPLLILLNTLLLKLSSRLVYWYFMAHVWLQQWLLFLHSFHYILNPHLTYSHPICHLIVPICIIFPFLLHLVPSVTGFKTHTSTNVIILQASGVVVTSELKSTGNLFKHFKFIIHSILTGLS